MCPLHRLQIELWWQIFQVAANKTSARARKTPSRSLANLKHTTSSRLQVAQRKTSDAEDDWRTNSFIVIGMPVMVTWNVCPQGGSCTVQTAQRDGTTAGLILDPREEGGTTVDAEDCPMPAHCTGYLTRRKACFRCFLWRERWRDHVRARRKDSTDSLNSVNAHIALSHRQGHNPTVMTSCSNFTPSVGRLARTIDYQVRVEHAILFLRSRLKVVHI
ncbi:hypothetical protein PLICRDRAFT_44774 [Plicaturopsis crispa FD-325 SS-3]|nr:hypothetical protein PLICRDRAFT_44774 [Plicaturopsis crispa FD-325 SS-3]